jgi:hypothetical protein
MGGLWTALRVKYYSFYSHSVFQEPVKTDKSDGFKTNFHCLFQVPVSPTTIGHNPDTVDPNFWAEKGLRLEKDDRRIGEIVRQVGPHHLGRPLSDQ